MAPATSLYWLAEPPDWAERLRAVRQGDTPNATAAWTEFVALANAPLDLVRTNQLDRAVRARFPDAPPSGLQTRAVRLAVLSSSNVAHLVPALRVGALRRGIWLSIYVGAYGQYVQELLDPASALHAFAPDDVLFAVDAHHMAADLNAAAGEDEAEDFHNARLRQLETCWRQAREKLGATVTQQAILPTFPALLGNNEHRLPASRSRLITRLNESIRAAHPAVDVLAVDQRCAVDGAGAWSQPSLWLRAKQEIAPTAAPLYGDLYGRLAAARQGRSYKCLALDLDNTLWGGVVGDDGVGGVVLGAGSAEGEAFSAMQGFAKDLARRGVLLAICSKNDETNAKAPFLDHPEMILKLGDISAFVASWDDKAEGLRRIAATLNIGQDAIVFVDDNPFERDLVRSQLPMVATPEWPEDVALLPACLSDAGYFEALGLTDEDVERTAHYAANAERAAFASDAGELATYLQGLGMELRCRAFRPEDAPRITQLINKTNQFNLTTTRLTRAEVDAVMDRDDAVCLSFRLVDRFGDNGLIAVVIATQVEDGLNIDTWLMSCRVLGREVERATLDALVRVARTRGVRALRGRYVASGKNAMVRDHYGRLGFSAVKEPGEDDRWELLLSAYRPADTPIRLILE